MEEKRPSEKAGDVPQKTEQTPLSQLRWKDRAEAAKGGLLGFFILFHVLFVFNDKNIKNREKLSVCNLNFRYS